MQTAKAAGLKPKHFLWTLSEDRVATITLDRPERKNPLTFESYAELRDTFRMLANAGDVRAVVITGAGGNFSSGGDVHEIIGPLTKMTMPELLAFTRMTGDLVKAIRDCPQIVIAAGLPPLSWSTVIVRKTEDQIWRTSGISRRRSSRSFDRLRFLSGKGRRVSMRSGKFA